MPKQAPKLIAPRRALVKWLTTLLVLLLPFIQPGGVSLLRLDAASRTLLFFGARIRLEEFFLLLLATLVLVFAFILLTLVFGRVWCGWLCPQTSLIDLAEFLERRLSGSWLGRGLLHAAFLLLSLLVGTNLVWYFITPQDFFLRLVNGSLGMVAAVTVLSVALVTWLNILFVRRIFCKAACPYGRIQLILSDSNTLTLEFDPASSQRCIRCGACVRACPTGIDIRDGLQVECINCGRCLDACRSLMARKGEPGIIHYTFGRRDEGGGRPLNFKTAAIGLLVILLSVILAIAGSYRKDVAFTLHRNALAPLRQVNGSTLVPYTAYLENRSSEKLTVTLRVGGQPKQSIRLLGPVADISLLPNQSQRIDFTLLLSPAPSAPLELDLILEGGGKIHSTQKLRMGAQ